MSCRCAPALVTLRDQVDALWLDRDRASDGCCGDAAHAARNSQHNPNANGYPPGYAHALDIDEDIVANMGDRPLWETGLYLLADVRCRYLIYEGRILYPDGRDLPYHGPNAHKHHLHISIKPTATHDRRPWRLAPVATTPALRRRTHYMVLVQVPGDPAVYLYFGPKEGEVGIEDPDDLNALKAAGIPFVTLTRATWDKWRSAA